MWKSQSRLLAQVGCLMPGAANQTSVLHCLRCKGGGVGEPDSSGQEWGVSEGFGPGAAGPGSAGLGEVRGVGRAGGQRQEGVWTGCEQNQCPAPDFQGACTRLPWVLWGPQSSRHQRQNLHGGATSDSCRPRSPKLHRNERAFGIGSLPLTTQPGLGSGVWALWGREVEAARPPWPRAAV